MGFFGFVNNLLDLRGGFNSLTLGDVPNALGNFKDNVNMMATGAVANVRGEQYPINQAYLTAQGLPGAVSDYFTPVGLNGQTFIVRQDILIVDDTANPPRQTQLTKGSVIGINNNPVLTPSNTGLGGGTGIFSRYDPRFNFFFQRDLNGDNNRVSRQGEEAYFNDSFGRMWANYGQTSNLYSQVQGTSQFDQANAHRLPIGLNRAAGDYVYATGNGEWIKVSRPYTNFDNINSAGRHPLTGQQLNSPYFNQQFGFNQFGFNQFSQFGPGGYNQFAPGGYDPRLYHDPYSNPFEWQNTIDNTINMYDVDPVTTYLKVVPQNDVTGNLALLRDYLLQDPNAYRDGFLNGFGAWTVTYDVNGDTKTITDAYLNQQGELIVEYA